MMRFLIVLALLPTGAMCPAQPEEMPSPEVIIEILRSAYRSGPIAEQVDVQVSGRDAGRRVGNVTVRLNASDPARPRLRLDLTPLQIWCDGRSLVAVSSRNDTLAVERELSGPPSLRVLGEVLRPLALPQLELAFSYDDRFTSPTPFTPGVRWLQVTEEPREIGGPRMLVLLGQWEGREVKMYVDKETDRLRGLDAQLGPPEDPDALELRIDIRPDEVGGAGQWTISTEGRELAGRLTDLTRRIGAVGVGEVCPELTLVRPGGTSWSLLEELEAARQRETPPHALCLVLHRFDRDPKRLEENAERARTALEALAPPGMQPWRVERHAGRIYELADYGSSGAAPTWDAATYGPLHKDHSPARSIELLAPGARVAVALIGLDRRVIHAAAVEDQNEAEIRTAAIEALRFAFPPQSSLDGTLDESPPESPPPAP